MGAAAPPPKVFVSANKRWVHLGASVAPLATEVAARGPPANRPPTRAVPASAQADARRAAPLRRDFSRQPVGLDPALIRANEGFRARSNAEMAAKFGICIQELDETAYWIELLIEAGLMTDTLLNPLPSETNELIAIFTTSVRKLRAKGERGSESL
nr:four helix bundle protein [Oscillochloris sp. ZM17-4]